MSTKGKEREKSNMTKRRREAVTRYIARIGEQKRSL